MKELLETWLRMRVNFPFNLVMMDLHLSLPKQNEESIMKKL